MTTIPKSIANILKLEEIQKEDKDIKYDLVFN